MPDLSVIDNEKLRKLMQDSVRFDALTEKEKQLHIEKIKDLPASKQEELCAYFINSNKEEKLTPADRIKKIYEEFLELQRQFEKLLGQEPERRERETDDKTMDTLLTKLNHI